MGLIPKPIGDFQRVDVKVLPPGDFVAALMELAVMAATQWDGELVADFEAQGSRLGKPQMVGIARLASAYQARLRSNEPQMRFVAATLGF